MACLKQLKYTFELGACASVFLRFGMAKDLFSLIQINHVLG